MKLTKEQQQLALDEIQGRWLRVEVFKQSPKWLVAMVGWEDLHALGELAVVRSAATYSAEKFPEVPFGAYALQIVRWEFNKLRVRVAKKARVWFSMKHAPDDRNERVPLTNFLTDYRRTDSPTLLSLWYTPEYREQRKALDPRGRLVLYLHVVEGWTFEEIGETFSVSKQAVHQIYSRIEHRLGEMRLKKAVKRQLAGRTA